MSLLTQFSKIYHIGFVVYDILKSQYITDQPAGLYSRLSAYAA